MNEDKKRRWSLCRIIWNSTRSIIKFDDRFPWELITFASSNTRNSKENDVRRCTSSRRNWLVTIRTWLGWIEKIASVLCLVERSDVHSIDFCCNISFFFFLLLPRGCDFAKSNQF